MNFRDSSELDVLITCCVTPVFAMKVWSWHGAQKFKSCHYKEAEPLTWKYSAEVAKAFQSIYKRSPLTWLNTAVSRKEMVKQRINSDV